ncbi:MAG: lipoprotein-releasing ABC transporter ATP-binding protein LolD [Legionellaceae bacterium]|nr:lipoprotein-releasing ABC transporter ATP-binding protein LolD [Legionellaceae bacterium]
MNEPVLSCQDLTKNYHDAAESVMVLRGIHLAVEAGERIAIVGPSGSGKSTLLHVLGGLDKPSSGTACVLGVDWQNLSEKEKCHQRNKYLGFIYQFHHLLPEFSALENVAMPLLIAKKSRTDALASAQAVLDDVGLTHRLQHKPAQLSGGERQRVAIARALVSRPACILADEPTGNLDHSTAQSVFGQMLDINRQINCALVIVTHDQTLAKRMDRCLTLVDGTLR